MKLLILEILLKIIVFVVLDEVQGFHCSNLQYTLHPVVVNYKDSDALQSVSYCIISDHNKHVVGMVFQLQKVIKIDLKLCFPYLSNVTFFLMGVQANIETVKICTTYATTSLTKT